MRRSRAHILALPATLAAAAALTRLTTPAAAQSPATDALPAPEAQPVALPSTLPGGDRADDTINLFWYPARFAMGPAPAVILIHALGDQDNAMMRRFACYLSNRGVGAAVMTLPWHMRRLPRGDNTFRHFLSREVGPAVQAFAQSAADVSAIADWLARRPDVDPHRIAAVGVSLGAIVTHLAMGKDARLTAGVAYLGGGDLLDIYRRSAISRLLHPRLPPVRGAAEREAIRTVDPVTYAGKNRRGGARHVLMVQAARDLLIPPADATYLWEALGRPPIRWLDTNHFAPLYMQPALMRAALDYLRAVWFGLPGADPERAIPAIYVPTIEVGALVGLDGSVTRSVTPAIGWQAVSFVQRRDHMSLLHADLGWSGRGPYVGLAATLNAYLDIGAARRLTVPGLHPYVSLHIAL